MIFVEYMEVPLDTRVSSFFFFFNDTATTEIYTLSLHDALPISACQPRSGSRLGWPDRRPCARRSEEHTSELQSPDHIVCRLLLEIKKIDIIDILIEVWSPTFGRLTCGLESLPEGGSFDLPTSIH